MLLQRTWVAGLVRRLAATNDGNVAVEFAMAAPFLILIAFGSFDYGRAYVEEIRMKGAARAGAQHALYEPTNWTNNAMIERIALEEYAGHALTDDALAGLPVSAAAASFCACIAGAELTCSATCPGGGSPDRFVRVRLAGVVPLTLPYPWSANGETAVAGQAVLRVR